MAFSIKTTLPAGGVAKLLEKDPHAFAGVSTGLRLLRDVPEAKRSRTILEVERLLAVWNITGPDAREAFALLEPRFGRALAASRRGGALSGKTREAVAARWKSVVPAVARDEKRKLEAKGERATMARVIKRLRVNEKTKDLLVGLKDSTIGKWLSVRTR